MKRILALGALAVVGVLAWATFASAATPAIGEYHGTDQFNNQIHGEIVQKNRWETLRVTDVCEKTYRFAKTPIEDDGSFNAVRKDSEGNVLLRIRGTFVKTVRVEGVIVDKNCEVGGEYVLKRMMTEPIN